MGALFIFILISVLVVSALLFFNKGEKAQEIKSILKDIFEDFRLLFSNFKKLFLIVKELIQAKLNQEPTQLKDESKESKTDLNAVAKVIENPELIAEPKVTAESEAISEPKEAKDLMNAYAAAYAKKEEPTREPKPIDEEKVTSEPEIIPTSEVETPSEDSINDKNTDVKRG